MKSILKKVLLLFTAAMCTLSVSVCAVNLMDDVSENDWFYSYVESAYYEGIIKGVQPRVFAPYDNLTFAQAFTIASRILKEAVSAVNSVEEYERYAAMQGENWWYGIKLYAQEKGLFEGMDFIPEPDEPCDRAHMVMLLNNAIKNKYHYSYDINDLNHAPQSFSDDAPINKAINKLFKLGVFVGEKGGFRLEENLTRAEAAAMAVRANNPQMRVEVYPGMLYDDPQTQMQAAVRSVLEGIKTIYPEGMRWTNDDYYMSESMNMAGYGCHAFALYCSDTAFGDRKAYQHYDFKNVRAGDILRNEYAGHTMVVMEKLSDGIIVAEGNYNSSIHYGRKIKWASLEKSEENARKQGYGGGIYIITRYPR